MRTRGKKAGERRRGNEGRAYTCEGNEGRGKRVRGKRTRGKKARGTIIIVE